MQSQAKALTSAGSNAQQRRSQVRRSLASRSKGNATSARRCNAPNATRWHSNELMHEAQKGKEQRMKATWLDKERGIYRVGDEHGDFIDDELHPIQRVCSPPLADRTIERRMQRKRDRKEKTK